MRLGCSGTEALRRRVLEKFSDKVYMKRAAVFIVDEEELALRRQQGASGRKPAAILYTDDDVLANRGETILLSSTAC